MKTARNWMWGLGVASLVAAPLIASTAVVHLPISAFLDVQTGAAGGCTAVGVSPRRCLAIDLFGENAKYWRLDVGTTFDGDVAVRELPDGTAHVSVLLRTQNAICWGAQWNGDLGGPAFGYAPKEIGPEHPASLGDGLYQVEFTMLSVNLPLPRAGAIIPPYYRLLSTHVVANCAGVLRSWSGYPEGTPGGAHATQVMSPAAGFPDHCPGGDCWPAEVVNFWPTGPR